MSVLLCIYNEYTIPNHSTQVRAQVFLWRGKPLFARPNVTAWRAIAAAKISETVNVRGNQVTEGRDFLIGGCSSGKVQHEIRAFSRQELGRFNINIIGV